MLCVLVFCLSAVATEAAQAASSASAQPAIKIQRGAASYLGKKFHGRRTANGEIYHEDKLTAAHRTLPFGTILRVTRLSNGRSAIVRINDRGPFIEGRHVDLSLAAARKLNMLRGGVTQVQFEVIGNNRGEPLRRGEAFYLAAQSANSKDSASKCVADVCKDIPEKLRRKMKDPTVFTREQDARLPGYFAGWGPFTNFSEAHAELLRFPATQRPEMICAKANPEQLTASK